MIADNEECRLLRYGRTDVTASTGGEICSFTSWNVERTGKDHDIAEKRPFAIALTSGRLICIGIDWPLDAGKPIFEAKASVRAGPAENLASSSSIFQCIMVAELNTKKLCDVPEPIAA